MGSFLHTTIKIPVELLLAKADQLTEFAEQNEEIYDRIENMLISMQDSDEWSGKSMVAALNSIQNNKKKHNEAVSDLYSLANYLRNFAQAMAAKDEDLQSRIRSI